MTSPRPALRRAAIGAVVVATLAASLVVPMSAATANVTGTLTYLERVTLSAEAVAIVTIVDHTAAPEAGSIVGQQRIDAPTTLPIGFAVPVEADTLDPTHAYGLYATIVDGTSSWQNLIGEPVITGGPSSGIALTLTAVPALPPASITGTIVAPEGTQFGPAAVTIAALIKSETGTLVSRQVRPIGDPADLAFSIGFDPALIDPTATYVVKGGVIDGSAVWANRAGVPAIAAGVPVATVALPVERTTTDLPAPSGSPTPVPSGTATPSQTAAATATATAIPTATAVSTATAVPTATPTPPATPTPTPPPTATPTAAPTATPVPTTTASPTTTPTTSPSGAPSPTPITGSVTGTLTYREPYQLTADAFAVVALVRGSARVTESSIVASEVERDISAKPVPFELDLDGTTIDPSETYTVQATIVDGPNAWVTSRGIPVLTDGNPSDVDIVLSYRPDLLKGAVSGQITAVGQQPSAGAYAMAVLVDPATGASLGIDVKSVTDGLPIAFAVGYTITDIDPTKAYVVTAEVGEGDTLWRNAAGVPVITEGNPTSGITVPVTAVAAPSPSASPTPVATPPPAPPPAGVGGSGLLPWIVLIAIVASVVAFLIARNRNEAGGSPPESGPPTTGGATEASASATVSETEAPGAETTTEAPMPPAPESPAAPRVDPDPTQPG